MSYTSKDGLLDAATGPGRKLVENFRLVVADEPNRGTLAVSDSTDFVMREYFGLRPVELLHRPGDVFSLTTQTSPGKYELEISPDAGKGPLMVRHRRADGQVLYEVPHTYELPVSDMDSATPWAILIDLTSAPSSPTITSVPNLATWTASKTLEELLDWAVLIHNKSATVNFGGLELRYGTSLSGGILSTQYSSAEGRALERKVRREASTTIAGQTAFSFVVNPGSPPTATLTGQGRLTFVRTGGAYTSVDSWTTTLTQTNPVLVATILPAADQATGTDSGTGGVVISAEPWSAVAADGGAVHARSVVLGHWDFAGPEGGMFYVRTVHGSVFQDGETFWLGRGAVLSDEEVARKYQDVTFFEAPTDIENYKLSLGYDPSRYMWTKDHASYLKGMQMVPSSDPDAPVGISAETLRSPFLDVRRRSVHLRRFRPEATFGPYAILVVSVRGPLQINMFWGAAPPVRGNEYYADPGDLTSTRFQISETGGVVTIDVVAPSDLVTASPSPTPEELHSTLSAILTTDRIYDILDEDGRVGYLLPPGYESRLPTDPDGVGGWFQSVVSDDGTQSRTDITTSGTAPFWTTLVDVQPGLFGVETVTFPEFRETPAGPRVIDARGGVVEAETVISKNVRAGTLESPRGLFDYVDAEEISVDDLTGGSVNVNVIHGTDFITGPVSTIKRMYNPSDWLKSQAHSSGGIDPSLAPTYSPANDAWSRWSTNGVVLQPRVIASGPILIEPMTDSLGTYGSVSSLAHLFRGLSWEAPPVEGVYEVESTYVQPTTDTDFSKPPPVGAFVVRASRATVLSGHVVMLEVRLNRLTPLQVRDDNNWMFWPHLELSQSDNRPKDNPTTGTFSAVPTVRYEGTEDRCILYSTDYPASEGLALKGYLTLYEYP